MQHGILATRFLLLLVVSAQATACGGKTAPASSGKGSVVYAIRNAAPADACPNGGISLDAGIDTNGDGALDPSEVASTQYICNGVDGLDGTDGTNGTDGANGTNGTDGANGLSALVSVTNEPPGQSCAAGGKKVSVGRDTNNNGVLDPSGITSSDYICNGADGADGTSGTNGANGLNTLVLVVSEPTGVNCANGGLKVDSGLDTDVDGVLDTTEVTSTTYVCNGAAGADGASGNNWPVADAGPDRRAVAAEILVTLDGSGSSDPDGDVLSYIWSVTTRPAGSLVALSSSSVVKPTFTPDRAGRYELSLIVSDGQANSLPDTVTVRVGTAIPDSGQTRWYSTAVGDDGDYTINPPSYTDNGDGTIRDNVTGLTWMKCSLGLSGNDCATGPLAIANWYQLTGTYDAVYNTTSINICRNLSLAGTGWRLPTALELQMIVDFGRFQPAIDTAYFPNTKSARYWASTVYAADPSHAWTVDFTYGARSMDTANDSPKSSKLAVRCVRN